MSDADNTVPPSATLFHMMSAMRLPRALQVAAELGLGEQLLGGNKTLQQLAETFNVDAAHLQRFLRFLVASEIIVEPEPGVYQSTPLSDELYILNNGVLSAESWAAWGALLDSLKTGNNAYALANGKPFYDYLADHPAKSAAWDGWNNNTSKAWAPLIAQQLQLEDATHVIDIGGGEGQLIIALLQQHPHLSATLLELPSVASEAQTALEHAGLAARCQVVGGDMFETIPTVDTDAIILSRVLPNWNDQQASVILQQCLPLMQPGTRLYDVSPVLPEPGSDDYAFIVENDLNCMVIWGSVIRTREAIHALYAEAGYQVLSITPLALPGAKFELITAVCA